MVDGPIKTFSVAFAEREANELAYARIVARRIGTDHHEVVVDARGVLRCAAALVWHEDEPIAHPSSVPLYFVSRSRAEHVKVVLTGEGSDETLAGYERYKRSLAELARRRTCTHGRARAAPRTRSRAASGACPVALASSAPHVPRIDRALELHVLRQLRRVPRSGSGSCWRPAAPRARPASPYAPSMAHFAARRAARCSTACCTWTSRRICTSC